MNYLHRQITPDEPITSFDSLHFDNRFVAELPSDPVEANYCRQVTGALHSRVQPFRVRNPQLLACSDAMLERLGLSREYALSSEFANIMAGNQLARGMQPYASCYGGHQFGQWAGQLGDGRAINLGDVINEQGERWALQLKGAGPTPYSRQADGFAVLRSSIREYLCSEAMHYLGVPTTRALSLVSTGEAIDRDMFYDGNVIAEPGAVVCRVAPSFTRFGHFQILAARGDLALLEQLLDYTLRIDFPDYGGYRKEVIGPWFREVCERTAEMIAHWLRVGFVHGVMNTDNMSILGLTIDYGPYGWLDDYDPDWTPNTTDAEHKRYRFGNQATVAHWNLVQLAQAIVQLTEEPEPLQDALDHYVDHFHSSWTRMMSHKLGLDYDDAPEHKTYLESVVDILRLTETDMTLFFRQLAQVEPLTSLSDEALLAPLQIAWYHPEELDKAKRDKITHWLRGLIRRWNMGSLSNRERIARMNRTNPRYVLRNYLAQQAIEAAEAGDVSLLQELETLLKNPYDEQPERERFYAKRPDWALNRAGCSMLSCSS